MLLILFVFFAVGGGFLIYGLYIALAILVDQADLKLTEMHLLQLPEW